MHKLLKAENDGMLYRLFIVGYTVGMNPPTQATTQTADVDSRLQETRMDRLSGWLGRQCLRPWIFLLNLTNLCVHSLGCWWQRGHLRNLATRRALVTQILFTGIDAMPLVLMLGLSIGLTLTPILLMLARNLGSDAELAHFLVQGLAIEMGPLLTAIILIGRSGSAITVEFAGMKQRGELASLTLMGINVSDYFIAPRILGTSIAQLVLGVYFTAIALFGGIAMLGVMVSGEHLKLIPVLVQEISASHVLLFAAKNLLFGLLIGATSCLQAVSIGYSPTEMPQKTQQAIVSSYLLIFALTGIFSLVSLIS